MKRDAPQNPVRTLKTALVETALIVAARQAAYADFFLISNPSERSKPFAIEQPRARLPAPSVNGKVISR